MTVGIEKSKPRCTTGAVGDDTAELEEELARATTPIHRRRLQNRIAQRNHRKRVRLAQQQQREEEEEQQRQQQEQSKAQEPDLEEEGQSNSAGDSLDPGMTSTPMRHPDPHARIHPGSPAVSRMSIDNTFVPSRTDFDFSMPATTAKPPTPISIDGTNNKSYRNSVSGCSFCMSCGAVNDVVDTQSLLDTSRRIQDWRPVSPIDFDDPVVDPHGFISLSQTQMNPDQHQPPPPPQQQQPRQQNHHHQSCHHHNHTHAHQNNATHHPHPDRPALPSSPAPAPPPAPPRPPTTTTTAPPSRKGSTQTKAGTPQKWTTALHIATERGHERSVRVLLGPQGGADVNEKDSRGATALHVAAANGDEAMVRTLLDCGADVHAADEQGWSALHRAAERGDEGVLVVLLGASAGSGGGGSGV